MLSVVSFRTFFCISMDIVTASRPFAPVSTSCGSNSNIACQTVCFRFFCLRILFNWMLSLPWCLFSPMPTIGSTSLAAQLTVTVCSLWQLTEWLSDWHSFKIWVAPITHESRKQMRRVQTQCVNRREPAPGPLGPLELGHAGVSKRAMTQVVISSGNPSFWLGEKKSRDARKKRLSVLTCRVVLVPSLRCVSCSVKKKKRLQYGPYLVASLNSWTVARICKISRKFWNGHMPSHEDPSNIIIGGERARVLDEKSSAAPLPVLLRLSSASPFRVRGRSKWSVPMRSHAFARRLLRSACKCACTGLPSRWKKKGWLATRTPMSVSRWRSLRGSPATVSTRRWPAIRLWARSCLRSTRLPPAARTSLENQSKQWRPLPLPHLDV